MLIPIKEAMRITGNSDRTIRDWTIAGQVASEKDEVSGILQVDKESLLQAVPTAVTMYNQKGGVGKTSLTVMLSDYFINRKLKVLLLDLDQQGNLSQTFLDYQAIRDSNTLYNYLEDKTPLPKCIQKINDNLDILPADLRISRKDNLDLDFLVAMLPDFATLFKKYQVILIDCPPSLSAMSKFGLLLTNYVFIPVVPEPYSYDGMIETINNLKRIIKFNDNFIDYRVVINSHEQRRMSLHENYVDAIKNDNKIYSLEQTIPTSVAVKERPLSTKTIFESYPNDKGVKKIEALFDEIYDLIYLKRGEK
jgi:chromosome partitioning protein